MFQHYSVKSIVIGAIQASSKDHLALAETNLDESSGLETNFHERSSTKKCFALFLRLISPIYIEQSHPKQ